MKKTGSELISEIVGPAGSTRKVGAFSRWMAAADEEELWREPDGAFSDDWVWPHLGNSAAPRQKKTADGTKYVRMNENRIDKTLLACLVRR
ncbi:MAG: hypothetical protein ACLPH3_05945, partial [Terracidiphilus sp.]